jgi:hypothetical protein
MTKHLFLTLTLSLLIFNLFGQSDYYSTNSVTTSGVNLIDGGDLINSKLCKVQKGDSIVKFTPKEIFGYGFKDGRVYFSKEIQLFDSTKRVFLERLITDSTSLYYYRDRGMITFFLEKNKSTLIEVPKTHRGNSKLNFKDDLQLLTSDCKAVTNTAKLVRYNKKSLSKFISRYNKCELKPFPFFKIGINVSYSLNKLLTSPNMVDPISLINQEDFNFVNGFTFRELNQQDFNYRSGFSFGVFIDEPIMVSNFSIHTELNYSKIGFSYNKIIRNQDIDIVANLSTLDLPILLRYVTPCNKFKPFINAGGVLNYNFKNDNAFYDAIIGQNIIEINKPITSTLISDYLAGYSMGAGLECKLNYKNSLFFEFRYNKLYGFPDSGTFNKSEIHFITGVNF